VRIRARRCGDEAGAVRLRDDIVFDADHTGAPGLRMPAQEDRVAIDPVVVKDVVIVLPGIMGSELVDGDDRPLWSFSPGGLAQAVKAVLKDERLTLPHHIGDDAPGDGVRASRLLRSLHVIPGLWSPVTGYGGLMSFLGVNPRFQLIEADPGEPDRIPNLIPFPYDWRLSCRYNARRLKEMAEPALERWRRQPGCGDAKLVLLCHSMGGLIARWYAEREGGAGLIRDIITLGTPHQGSVKALTALVNGLGPSLGPLHWPLASLGRLTRSLPSLYQLLPQYKCWAQGPERVTLAEAGDLGLDRRMLEDADAFHEGIKVQAASCAYKLHKFVGTRQPTPTTARWAGDRIEALEEIDGMRQGGDGTVSRLAATPEDDYEDNVTETPGQHGELQGVEAMMDQVESVLTRRSVVRKSGRQTGFGIRMEEVFWAGQQPMLEVADAGDHRLYLTLTDELGRIVESTNKQPIDDHRRVLLPDLPEGGYRATVEGAPGGPEPISKPFMVLKP